MWKGVPRNGSNGTMVNYMDYVYGESVCGAYCVDLKTGETIWLQKGFPHDDAMCWPVLADGKIFTQAGPAHSYGSADYPVVMFKATPEKYIELGLFRPHAAFLNGIAIANGKMFVRTVDSVACYDIEDHTPSAPVPVLMPSLTVRKCIENTIILEADGFLPPEGRWGQTERYQVAGAAVTKAVLDATCRRIFLTTDKSWKKGEKLSLTCSCSTGPKSEPRRDTLSFTVTDARLASVQFVKIDEMTQANWTNLYGSEGCVSADPNVKVTAPTCAVVRRPANAREKAVKDYGVWTAGAKDGVDCAMDLSVEITDGKEHQVAVRCLDFNSYIEMQIDVLDADTLKKLDTRNVNKIKGSLREGGTYAVWNVQGGVILRLWSTQMRVGAPNVGEVFIDPVAK